MLIFIFFSYQVSGFWKVWKIQYFFFEGFPTSIQSTKYLCLEFHRIKYHSFSFLFTSYSGMFYLLQPRNFLNSLYQIETGLKTGKFETNTILCQSIQLEWPLKGLTTIDTANFLYAHCPLISFIMKHTGTYNEYLQKS